MISKRKVGELQGEVVLITLQFQDFSNHRSDAFSSIGSLIGIGGAILGFPVLDSIASVVICLCILKVAYDILVDAVKIGGLVSWK